MIQYKRQRCTRRSTTTPNSKKRDILEVAKAPGPTHHFTPHADLVALHEEQYPNKCMHARTLADRRTLNACMHSVSKRRARAIEDSELPTFVRCASGSRHYNFKVAIVRRVRRRLNARSCKGKATARRNISS